MSIAKGLAKTAENVVWMEANTMQIFSRNPRGSNFKVYTDKEEVNSPRGGEVSEAAYRAPFWPPSGPRPLYYEPCK